MLTGILAGLGAGALWGLVFVAPRMLTGFSSVDLTAGRFIAYGVLATAAVLLGRLAGARARNLPSLRHMLMALGMSMLGFTGYYLLLVLAIRDAGSEVPSLVIGTIPVWIMLIGKPKHLRWLALLPGLLLTCAGLWLMMRASQGQSGQDGEHFWRGMGWVLLSLISWTAFAILNSAWLKRHPEVSATDWASWLGVATGLGASALWLVAGSDLQTLGAQPGLALFVVLSIVTGFGSAWLATVLWNIASQRLSASLCGQLIVSETVFALLYSFVWDGRWPSALQLIACVLFVLGILASIKAHR